MHRLSKTFITTNIYFNIFQIHKIQHRCESRYSGTPWEINLFQRTLFCNINLSSECSLQNICNNLSICIPKRILQKEIIYSLTYNEIA